MSTRSRPRRSRLSESERRIPSRLKSQRRRWVAGTTNPSSSSPTTTSHRVEQRDRPSSRRRSRRVAARRARPRAVARRGRGRSAARCRSTARRQSHARVDGRARVVVRHLPVEVPELRAAERQAAELDHQRLTRAPAPPTSERTSASVAVEVSPGVVIASAPCAAPYSTASCRLHAREQPVDEPGDEAVAAADAVEDLEVAPRRRLDEAALGATRRRRPSR